MPDPLDRFLDAQAPVIERVRAELAAGEKRTHWMWFVFPQIAGLGHTDMARTYALADLAEAQAFLAHPVLGPRLKGLTRLVLLTDPARSAFEIFGKPDDRKFRSCMTLFAAADPGEPLFHQALARFYGGAPDPLTLDILGQASDGA